MSTLTKKKQIVWEKAGMAFLAVFALLYVILHWQDIYDYIYFYQGNQLRNQSIKNVIEADLNKSTSEPFSVLSDWNNWGLDLFYLRSVEEQGRTYVKSKMELNPQVEKKFWFDYKSELTGTNLTLTLSGMVNPGDANVVMDESYYGNFQPVRPTAGTSVRRLDCRVRKVNDKSTIEMIVRITDKDKSPTQQDNTVVPYTVSCQIKNLKPGTYYVDYFQRWMLTGIYKPLNVQTFGEKYRGIKISDEEYYFDVITIP